jgi:DNA-binding response OmpR family regulator
MTNFPTQFDKTILCVEDDLDTCELLDILLADWQIDFVHRLNDAQKKLEKSRFDLYILDNWLPDGSGIDLCHYIRKTDDGAPIIFTSAVGNKTEIKKAREAGAVEYLVKPYEPENLQKIVKELLFKI